MTHPTPPRRHSTRASLLGGLVASTILVVAACSPGAESTAPPSPSPAEVSSPSVTAAATFTPTPTPAPSASPVSSAAATPEPSLGPSPEPTRTPRPTPRPLRTLAPVATPKPEPSAAPEYPDEVAGYAIDKTTGLPVVPEAEGGPWWWTEEPSIPLDPALRFTSEAPASDAIDPDVGRISLLAEFGSHEAALEVGTALDAALGNAQAEAAWLKAAGYPGGLGFDWLGSSAATTPFVDVIDRWLIVSELAYRAELDPGPAVDFVPRYGSPLALALTDVAEQLIVEETSSADKYAAFDLVCRGDDGALLTLQQDLADNAEIYDMQPVWLEPGITDEQRRARRTLRLVDTLAAQVVSRLPDDVRFQELAQALGDARDSGFTATEEAFEDLRAYIEGWVVASRPDLEPLYEYLDLDVIETSAEEYARRAALQVRQGRETRPANVISGQFAAAPFGAHSAPVPWIMGEARTYAGLGDGEMTLSLGLFHGVAAGLGPLTEYLAANGCDEMSVSFIDYGMGVNLRAQAQAEAGADAELSPDEADVTG